MGRSNTVMGRRRVPSGSILSGVLLGALWALGIWVLGPTWAAAQELRLDGLIAEALENNPELHAAAARIRGARYKIPQAESLPDPMLMAGYQNEGFERYTWSESQDAQWMFSASQMFPFPGKRGLKGEMASKDAENAEIQLGAMRRRVVLRVKELYFDLFLAYKTLDLLRDRTDLFSRIEEAALARYSSGMGQSQEAVMAQTEKYMLRERAEMARQRIESLEAMLAAALGRKSLVPLGRPAEPEDVRYGRSLDELLGAAASVSPELKSREKMVEQGEVKVEMARKEFYPDFTIGANYFSRGNTQELPDMWSLTTQINIPLYAGTKQEMGVREAKAGLREARHELRAAEVMLASAIRDNHSMVMAAERLIEIYKNGLIPKNYQDVQLAVSGYATGKVEAVTAVSRLRSLLDYETSYWTQVAEKHKAIARLEALAGDGGVPGPPAGAGAEEME